MSSELSILFILDNSGSMNSLGDEPRQSLNNFYKDQKKNGKFSSSLLLFNDNHEYSFKNKHCNDIEDEEIKNIHPGGMTALYDAIWIGCEEQLKKQTDNILVVILSDGEDNSSKHTNKEIKKLITKLETENGWKFIFLGANIDTRKVSTSLGITSSIDYEFSEHGCNNLMRMVSDNVGRIVSGDVDLKNFDLGKNENDGMNLSPKFNHIMFNIEPLKFNDGMFKIEAPKLSKF